MSRYQVLTLVTVAATLFLIAVGSTVRTTGSGLGCPDWPLCHGNLLPPLEREAIIEWSHRTTAAVVGLLILVQAVWTLRVYRADRALTALAVASLPLLAFQAYLGREAVARELPPEVVAFHLFTALTLIAILAVMAAFAWQGPAREPIETRERRGFTRLAVAGAVVAAGVLAVGAYTVATHAGFACTTWPSCIEAPRPFLDGDRLHHIHWLHRVTVVAGLGAVAAIAWYVRTMREAGPALRLGANALLALYALQIVIGAGNIWSGFAEAVRVAHLVVGSAIWALFVVLAVAGRYRPALRPAREPARATRPADARA